MPESFQGASVQEWHVSWQPPRRNHRDTVVEVWCTDGSAGVSGGQEVAGSRAFQEPLVCSLCVESHLSPQICKRRVSKLSAFFEKQWEGMTRKQTLMTDQNHHSERSHPKPPLYMGVRKGSKKKRTKAANAANALQQSFVQPVRSTIQFFAQGFQKYLTQFGKLWQPWRVFYRTPARQV